MDTIRLRSCSCFLRAFLSFFVRALGGVLLLEEGLRERSLFRFGFLLKEGRGLHYTLQGLEQ